MDKQVVLPDLPKIYLFLRDNVWGKSKTFFLPTDPTKKLRVGKEQTKYFLI